MNARNKKPLPAVFKIGAFVMGAAITHSAVALPANNNCSNATPIGNGSYSFSTINATTDGPTFPSCWQTSAFADVWYRYTAQANGTVTADTCGANFDTILVAY